MEEGKTTQWYRIFFFKRRKVRREITAKLQTQQEFQKPKTERTGGRGREMIIKK